MKYCSKLISFIFYNSYITQICVIATYVLYFTIFDHDFRNSCLQLFCKKRILKNSGKFIGKNLCRSKNKIASILNHRRTFVQTIEKYMKKNSIHEKQYDFYSISERNNCKEYNGVLHLNICIKYSLESGKEEGSTIK